MSLEIAPLPKEQWAGYPIPISYTTDKYYDVIIEKKRRRL